MEAVKKDGWSIQFIHNPDKDMQLEAVRRNGKCILYCPKLFPELLTAYLVSKECPKGLKQEFMTLNGIQRRYMKWRNKQLGIEGEKGIKR